MSAEENPIKRDLEKLVACASQDKDRVAFAVAGRIEKAIDALAGPNDDEVVALKNRIAELNTDLSARDLKITELEATLELLTQPNEKTPAKK